MFGRRYFGGKGGQKVAIIGGKRGSLTEAGLRAVGETDRTRRWFEPRSASKGYGMSAST